MPNRGSLCPGDGPVGMGKLWIHLVVAREPGHAGPLHSSHFTLPSPEN